VNKLLIGWRPYVIAAVVIALLLAVYLIAQSRNDRFGDSSTLDQIKSSTDCDELQQWADAVLATDPDSGRAFDQAVGYSNAANDRMKEIGC
jgi:hypothetical protein